MQVQAWLAHLDRQNSSSNEESTSESTNENATNNDTTNESANTTYSQPLGVSEKTSSTHIDNSNQSPTTGLAIAAGTLATTGLAAYAITARNKEDE